MALLRCHDAESSRAFAWLGRSRRLSKDHQRPCATTENRNSIAMARPMQRRLTAP
jgi:hypothetical protein